MNSEDAGTKMTQNSRFPSNLEISEDNVENFALKMEPVRYSSSKGF